MKKILTWSILFFSLQVKADVGDWVRNFVHESEGIQVFEQQYSSVIELKKEAKTKFFPSISLEGAYLEQEVPTALTGGFDLSPKLIYDAGIVVEQPVYLGGRIWAGVKQRNAQAARAKGELRNGKNKVLSEFLDLIYQKQKAMDLVFVLKQSQKRLRDFVVATEKRTRLGNSRSYELSQAKSSELAYIPRIQNLKIQIDNLNEKINELIAVDRQPKKQESVFLRQDQMEILRSKASKKITEHPEWTVAEQNVEYAQASKSYTLGEHYPSLILKGKWGYRSTDRRDIGESTAEASQLSVGISIPLFSGLSSLYIRRSQQAQIKAAQLTKELKRKSLVAGMKASEKSLNSLIQQLNDVNQWRNLAAKALREGLKNYRLGVIDNFQVVNLQQGIETAESTYIETRFNLNVAFKNWCISHGWDLDKVYTSL